VSALVPELPFKGDLSPDAHIKRRPLKTLDDVEILFKYYMEKGIGDERYVVDKKVFDQLQEAARKHASDIDLGGNASTMAQRAYLEGCFTRLGFPLDEFYYSKYFNSDTTRAPMVSPLQQIKDIHLSINYFVKDNIWDIKTPRSNRIFLNHDEDNNLMVELDASLKQLKDVDIVVLGGTQLPFDFTNFKSQLLKFRSVLSRKEHKAKQIHLESSAFNNYTFYETQLDILLPRVLLCVLTQINSFGMNEREFIEFAQYLESKKNYGTHYDIKAKYNQNFLIKKLFEVLNMIDDANLPMNRVSVHTINFHMVCFDRSIWRSGKSSVARAIVVSLQTAGGYTEENFERIADDLELLDFSFPDSIEIFTTYGKITRTRNQLINSPVFSFRYGSLLSNKRLKVEVCHRPNG